jgi:hypothetical protein
MKSGGVVGGGGGTQDSSKAGLTHTGNAPDGSLGFGGVVLPKVVFSMLALIPPLNACTPFLLITPPMPPTTSKTMSLSILV